VTNRRFLSSVGRADALTIPVAQLAVITVISALAGVWAAIMPSRRAARIDVLRAVSST
jgi:putative ABC transport system permease protein